uniref:Uncharacterized protein n=1 Tax=Cacopsylla melanoneura TaxID=428564 RepID=A0A8D8Z5Z9_9HEMI
MFVKWLNSKTYLTIFSFLRVCFELMCFRSSSHPGTSLRSSILGRGGSHVQVALFEGRFGFQVQSERVSQSARHLHPLQRVLFDSCRRFDQPLSHLRENAARRSDPAEVHVLRVLVHDVH